MVHGFYSGGKKDKLKQESPLLSPLTHDSSILLHRNQVDLVPHARVASTGRGDRVPQSWGGFAKHTCPDPQVHLLDSDRLSVGWEVILAFQLIPDVKTDMHPKLHNDTHHLGEAGCARAQWSSLGPVKPCRLTCVLGHVVL